MTRRPQVVFLSGLVVLALLVSACGNGASDGVAEREPQPEEDDATEDEGQAGEPQEAIAACGEADAAGSLLWYSAGLPQALDETVAAFRDLYPDADVEVLRAASGELGTRYSAERSAEGRTADVVTIADPTFLATGAEKGWFETDLDLPALEEWPTEFYENGVATTGVVPFVLGYNTDLVAEGDVPQEWEDLLDPQWKGKMQVGDPRAASSYMAVLEMWYQELGEDFIREFAAQDATPFASSVPASQQVAAGGAALIVPSPNTVLVTLAAEGAPVASTPISPTTGAELDTAISTDSPEPCLARLFVNFLLTEDGQAAFNSFGGTSVLGPLDEDMLPLPDGYLSMAPLLESAREHEEELLSLMGLE